VLQFRQRARGPDADHGPPGVELAIEGLDVSRGLRLREIHVDRGQNSARERQQMRRKHDLVFRETGMLEDLGRMPVREQPIGLEILVDFDEMQIAARILAGAARAGLAIANNAGVRGDPTGFRERAQSKDHAGGITAGIGNQSSR